MCQDHASLSADAYCESNYAALYAAVEKKISVCDNRENCGNDSIN
jgi:hypothetical protein